VVLLAVWYYCLVRYNRRKGATALHSFETACLGKGRVIEARWLDACRLQARLSFATHLLENARVTIRLFHRPMPVHWLISLWRKQKETVTFEADLDYVPGFQLEVFRHRWVTHKNASTSANAKAPAASSSRARAASLMRTHALQACGERGPTTGCPIQGQQQGRGVRGSCSPLPPPPNKVEPTNSLTPALALSRSCAHGHPGA